MLVKRYRNQDEKISLLNLKRFYRDFGKIVDERKSLDLDRMKEIVAMGRDIGFLEQTSDVKIITIKKSSCKKSVNLETKQANVYLKFPHSLFKIYFKAQYYITLYHGQIRFPLSTRERTFPILCVVYQCGTKILCFKVHSCKNVRYFEFLTLHTLKH